MNTDVLHKEINNYVEEGKYFHASGLVKETLHRDKLNDIAKIFYDHYKEA